MQWDLSKMYLWNIHYLHIIGAIKFKQNVSPEMYTICTLLMQWDLSKMYLWNIYYLHIIGAMKFKHNVPLKCTLIVHYWCNEIQAVFKDKI